MTGRGTNSYLVGAADVVVVDPGPDDDAHLDALVTRAGGEIRYVLVTHAHPDHSAGARRLAARTGAALLGPPPSGAFSPDAVLSDGDVVAVPGWRLEVLETPGHCADHLCFVLEEAAPGGVDAPGGGSGTGRRRHRVLLSGDHVLGGTSTVVAAPGGDMAAYVASLERLLALAPPLDEIAPGHGEMLGDARAVLEAYVARRRAREAEVVAALELAPGATPAEIAAAVYPTIAPGLEQAALAQTWAHLRKLHDDGRASSPDPASPHAPWTAP